MRANRSRWLWPAGALPVVATFVASAVPPAAHAQPAVYESEPNNNPAEFNKVAGAVTIMGTLEGEDQDGYMWTVSDVDAQKRWTMELKGIPGRLTIVEVVRIEYADNGVDVAAKHELFKMGTRDGSKPSLHEDLLFEPGEYILGVAHSGGSGSGEGGGAFRPAIDSISFEEVGKGEPDEKKDPGGYRLAIRQGSRIILEKKPKDRASSETAFKLRLGTENAAYLETAASWYQLEITEKDSANRWDLDGQVPIGHQVRAVFRSADGAELATTSSDNKGKLAFRDLGLETGSYTIEMTSKDAGYIRALVATSVGQRIEGAEAEPNDKWQLANRADLSQPVTGRMGKVGESDFFLFTLDEATADQVLALRLETGADQQFEFCLLDSKGARVQCRTGKESVELPDLVLQPGDWGLVVGRGPDAAEYIVTMAAQGPIQAGVEAEPNDKIEFAAAVPSSNRIKGRFSGQEDDFYRILVTDEPQLWRFQVIGDEIHELAYHDGAGIQNQRYRVPAGQRRVRLDNVFLLPGAHHVRVSGYDGGTYTLLARAIGPPDPNGEFEPNDDTSRMQPLRFGQTRTGLLEDKADSDNYRIYLAHWDRIRLTIEPPPDGEIKANLYWDTKIFKQFNNPRPGQRVVLEGLFPPGDYRLALSAQKTSEAEYKLSLERLERFGCPTDCEPNDNIAFASPLPVNHILEGRVNEWRDADWYSLPVFDEPTEMTAASEPRQQIALVEQYQGKSLLQWDHDAQLWRGTIPAGVHTYLKVTATRETPYRFELNLAGGPEARSTPTELPLELDIDLEATEVGAYRLYGQQVGGKIQLTNSGSASTTVTLEAATSDFRWRVELEETQTTIPGGAKHAVPLTLHVPADAWADWPVRISARAATQDGAQTAAFVDSRAGRETPPVNAVYGWALPAELRGGFNVAWDALGGRYVGNEENAFGSWFEYLIDGMAVENRGVQLRGAFKTETADLTVELAGGEPVEVAGLTLNLLSGTQGELFLKNLDVSLSTDGKQFTPVLAGVLVPIQAEQAFVLDPPVKASYARLHLKDTWEGRPKPSLSLGELKVIAKPGFDISGGKGLDIADPNRGGHVAWSRPTITLSGWDHLLLQGEDEWHRVRIKPDQTQDFVIGFHHSRAAQITRLEWHDAAKAEDDKKFRRVALSVSTDSPLGPWQPLGDWDLTSTGSPAAFKLDQPVWARYVKFSATGGDAAGTAETPALIKIWERPTGGEYKSILAEWGFASQAAIYEELHPLRVDKPFETAGHDSKAKAAPLEFGQFVGGQVVLGKHDHWYKLNIPADENTLTIAIGGDPTVRTILHLENGAGESVAVRKIHQESTPQLHILEAIVDPGGTYFLKIEEPPRNVVFLWDTSASVGAFLPVIYNSLIAYSEDVVPGRDAANLIPFGGNLLLRDWYGEPYILQTVLNDYPRKENSSEAEKTMHTASRALAPRAGTKAIVMVTDAATNRYPSVWDEFDRVQPRIFGLGVGSQGALGRYPKREQDLMQDWSRVNGGHYTHLLSEGEMEIAFDRASTMLRRPAGYTLEVASTFREAPGPGALTVVSAGGGTSAGGAAIELILDASGSMLKRMDGKRRIIIAKEVLSEAVNEHIPAGTPVALRVFGHKEPNSCRTDLEIALTPLDPAAASKTLQGVNAMNLAKTPIADSLAKVESDLKRAEGSKVVVLVTDGEETCEGDPERVIQTLRDKGFDVTLNIVGFAIDDAELESQFESWATLGGGRYFSAKNQEGLSESLEEALRVPFSVYDSGGTLVGEGVVDGEPLELEQGFYRVVVATSPPQTFDKVEVPGEKTVQIEVPK